MTTTSPTLLEDLAAGRPTVWLRDRPATAADLGVGRAEAEAAIGEARARLIRFQPFLARILGRGGWDGAIRVRPDPLAGVAARERRPSSRGTTTCR